MFNSQQTAARAKTLPFLYNLVLNPVGHNPSDPSYYGYENYGNTTHFGTSQSVKQSGYIKEVHEFIVSLNDFRLIAEINGAVSYFKNDATDTPRILWVSIGSFKQIVRIPVYCTWSSKYDQNVFSMKLNKTLLSDPAYKDSHKLLFALMKMSARSCSFFINFPFTVADVRYPLFYLDLVRVVSEINMRRVSAYMNAALHRNDTWGNPRNW